MNNKLEVISLTKKSLRDALKQNTYWNIPHESPFSINKASWMLNNPRAKEDDLMALLGLENNKVVALVSVLPDLITNKLGEEKNIFWITRWWVTDKYDGTIFSTYILNEAVNKINKLGVIKFLGSDTEKFYSKQPFRKFSIRDRYIVLYSLNHNFLVGKIPYLKKIALLLKPINKGSALLVRLINRVINKRHVKTLDYKYIENVDQDLWCFIKEQSSNDLVSKTKDYINWQIDNRQYISMSELVNKQKKYSCNLFSVANKIYNVNISVIKKGVIVGFISALVKDSRFTLRYFLFSGSNKNNCFNVLMTAFLKSKCTSIQTTNNILGEMLENRYLKIYSNKREVFSLMHNNIQFDETSSHVLDQDGSFI